MNARTAATALVLVLSTGSAHADVDLERLEDRAPESMVLADLGLHVIGLGYQRTMTPELAVQLDGDFYGPWTHSLAHNRSANATIGGVLRARAFYYLTGAAPHGWWLSPFVQGGAARGNVDHTVGPTFAVGIAAGYAWLFSHGITLAVGIGAQFDYAHTDPGFQGVWPHADLNVGYAF